MTHAFELNVRVVEMGSIINFVENHSVSSCEITSTDGCRFEYSGQARAELKVETPQKYAFEAVIQLPNGCDATLFVHVKRQREYLQCDYEVDVGDVIRSRSLTGYVIPQTAGIRRSRVSFVDYFQ